jgi:hypothetical protein
LICPPEYISLSRFLDLMELEEENPLWEEFGHRCASDNLVNLYSVADLIRFRLFSFLGDNVFSCDYAGNVLRIDSSVFSSMLSMNPPSGSRTKSRDDFFAASYGQFNEFRLGFRLDRSISVEFQQNERALKFFNQGVTYRFGTEGILTKFDDNAEALAANMQHFVYQDGFLTSPVFINYKSSSIDFTLYDWAVAWEAENEQTELEPNAHIWADIMRPIDGQFLCVPKEFLPTPNLKKEFAAYAADVDFPLENEVSKGPRKRGAKPSDAKAEYYRLYPAGKPERLSYDAIAAQLTELGFAVVGRTVQNYENARNHS